MATLRDLRAQILHRLKEAGIDSIETQREADLIIEHVCGLDKARQMAFPENEVQPHLVARVESVVSRRATRLPLQYILGEQWFMGLRFAVQPGVLIPRPDTETLVSVALDFLQKLPEPTFVDVGCGSGAIAVSLLKLLPAAKAYAIDVSEKAVELTAANAAAHGVYERLTVQRCSWQEFHLSAEVDALISNPPYVPLSQAAELAPEVGVFEPKEAIFGIDDDGLGFFRLLYRKAFSLLRTGGLLAVEVGIGQAETLIGELKSAGWSAVEAHADLNRVSRCISALHAVGAIGKQP